MASYFGPISNLAPHPDCFFEALRVLPFEALKIIEPFAPTSPMSLPRSTPSAKVKLQKALSVLTHLAALDSLEHAPATSSFFTNEEVVRKRLSASGRGASCWLINPSPRDGLPLIPLLRRV